MVFEINGKVALVTGGANGIGLAYVKELLKNGAKGISIVDVSANGDEVAAELNNRHGDGTVIFTKANVINKNEFAAAFDKTVSYFKSVDIVINNAGVFNDADWEKEIAVNSNAVVEGSLLAMKHMGKNNGGKGGVVANTASILGLQEVSGCPIYVSTKHFVVGLTRSFGTEYYWNLTGVKFVTICPGLTDTSLVTNADKYVLQGYPNLAKTFREEIATMTFQAPTNVAEGMITMITKGENGSVWVSEGGQPVYEIAIPDRHTLRKQ